MIKTTIKAITIFLISAFTLPVWSQEAPVVLDSPATHAELLKARELAGDDKYLKITQLLQCRDTGANGMPTQPGGNREFQVATQLFDNLYFIGNESVATFILTTPDGYIMIDAGWADYPYKFLMPGFAELGLDPALVQYILITHTGPDHVGGAKYFQDKYGTRVVMSEEEWRRMEGRDPIGRDVSAGLPEEYLQYIGNPIADLTPADGHEIVLGGTVVTMMSTPRRVNGGGFSYMFRVTDNGVPHIFSTYGNTNIVGELEDKYLYRESIANFIEYTEDAGADVIISDHPFVDGSLMRIGELSERQAGEANPFVVGKDYVQRFIAILDQCAVVAIARHEEGLDFTGTQRLD